MGTLGTYLSGAREALGLDLHDAAQQTRINVHYIKAMEEEDFTKLPGEVFIKGFLRNYGRFLNLPEGEVMKRYADLRSFKTASSADSGQNVEQKVVTYERKKTEEVPIEPFVWGAGIFIALIIFLFTARPGKHEGAVPRPMTVVPAGAQSAVPAGPVKPGKLYLEIVALEDVWILVRTDSSPQKKSVLKKGENITWSADQRFLLSCGSVGAVKLLLNGRELTVTGPKNAVVRDLTITASGIVNQNLYVEQPRTAAIKPLPKPSAQPGQAPSPSPQVNPAQKPAAAPGPDSF